jgi:hypothetical protein
VRNRKGRACIMGAIKIFLSFFFFLSILKNEKDLLNMILNGKFFFMDHSFCFLFNLDGINFCVIYFIIFAFNLFFYSILFLQS